MCTIASSALGTLQCSLKGFDADLDGITKETVAIYEWTFEDEVSNVKISQCIQRRCQVLYYTGKIGPPWQVRVAACVVHTLAAFEIGHH